MNKITEALNLAEALENDAKEHREVSYGLDCPPERTANWKHALNCEAAARLIREALADHSGDANEMVAPEGYALISVDALKAWGKYDEVRSACRFPAEPMNRPQNCGTGYCSCIECPYEPVKQEPVAEIKVSYTEIDGESFEVISCELDCGLHKLYAAPVSVEAAVLAEREACAKVCEEYALESMEAFNRTGHDFEDGQVNGGYGCAAAIRARGEK